jgi:hypothetical protein
MPRRTPRATMGGVVSTLSSVNPVYVWTCGSTFALVVRAPRQSVSQAPAHSSIHDLRSGTPSMVSREYGGQPGTGVTSSKA